MCLGGGCSDAQWPLSFIKLLGSFFLPHSPPPIKRLISPSPEFSLTSPLERPCFLSASSRTHLPNLLTESKLDIIVEDVFQPRWGGVSNGVPTNPLSRQNEPFFSRLAPPHTRNDIVGISTLGTKIPQEISLVSLASLF